jgi:Ca2+-binding EF-hand superfamily protein
MGSKYDTCKKCFPVFPVSSLEDNRNQFFHDVASLGVSARNISKEAFAKYIDSAGRALSHPLEETFALYDGNQDGVIDRDEFDAPHIIGFQRESGLETVV